MKFNRYALAAWILAALAPVAIAGMYVDDLTVTGTLTANASADTAVSTTPAGPSATGSTAGVMMGLAGRITPATTGRILLIVTGDTINNTANDGTSVQCAYGTGAAPTNNAAASGTNVGNPVKFINAASTTEKVPFACQSIITGLTKATGYWLDVNLAAITGGSATIADVTISAHEF